MNRARRAHENAPQQVQVEVAREVVHRGFLVGGVTALPDGGRVLSLVMPDQREVWNRREQRLADGLRGLGVEREDVTRSGDRHGLPPANGSGA